MIINSGCSLYVILTYILFCTILSVLGCLSVTKSLSVKLSKMSKQQPDDLQRAADAILNAKALIFTSGAGMGVDSGLPDFRGPEGFWRAYPALKDKGLHLQSMSNPSWFVKDPQFAWGFFGHRYNLYSGAEPHQGFEIILNWGQRMERGYFAFTSNVDGHAQVRKVLQGLLLNFWLFQSACRCRYLINVCSGSM